MNNIRIALADDHHLFRFGIKAFLGKYEECEILYEQIFGRCQHPIVSGSGTGVFEGVEGRLDFNDDVSTGIFYYKGHLRF